MQSLKDEVQEILNKGLGRDLEVDEGVLRERLNQAVFQSLRPATAVLSVLLVLIALANLYRPRAAAVPTFTVAMLSAALMVALNLALKYRPPAPRYANFLGVVVVGLLLLQRTVSFAFSLDMQETFSFIAILIGAGFVLLSTRWLALVVVVMSVVWTGGAIQAVPLSEWWPYALRMASIIALTWIIHETRLRALRQQEALRQQNQRHTAELERQALQLETLIAVGQDINAQLDLDTLLNDIVDLIQTRFGYYYVGVFLVDETGQYVVSRAGSGDAGKRLTREGFRLKIGEEGLIGWVAQNRQSLYVNDVSQDSRHVSTDIVPETNSELVLPLIVGENFLGVLDIQCDQRGAFAPTDVRVFQSLGDQVAIAIQNAFRYREERTRRLLTETLNTIGRALSQTLDRQEVLGLILQNLVKLVPFDRGSVMLQRNNATEIVAAQGFPPESNPLNISVPIRDNDVFDQLRGTKRPLIIANVLDRSDWHQVEGLPLARSWMGVPLIDADDKVIGMLSLTRETSVPYTEDEAQQAITFAGQAAVALQNARLYSRLAFAYEQLERLDRTKSDFITVASHELRTPLTVLKALSQILLKDPQIESDPSKHQMAEGIFESTVRLHEIVDSMIDMAKIDSEALQLHVTPFSIMQLLKTVASRYQDALDDRNLTLTVDVPPDFPKIEADQELLQKVFSNLILNAIKYTPDGGTITLTAQPASEDDEKVEIIVQDTGIGIDPRYHDLIFSKFYQTGEVALHSSGRTKFKGGGPGLGLAIAKGVVETHSGQIWVESPGYDEVHCPGSRFYVALPKQQPRRATEPKTFS